MKRKHSILAASAISLYLFLVLLATVGSAKTYERFQLGRDRSIASGLFVKDLTLVPPRVEWNGERYPVHGWVEERARLGIHLVFKPILRRDGYRVVLQIDGGAPNKGRFPAYDIGKAGMTIALGDTATGYDGSSGPWKYWLFDSEPQDTLQLSIVSRVPTTHPVAP